MSELKKRYLCRRDHSDPVPGLKKAFVKGALRPLDCRLELVKDMSWLNERVGAMSEHLL